MTDHAYEIAHDTRYYELLLAEYDAREKLDRERGYLIEMASDDPEGFSFSPRRARSEEAAYEAFPVGSIYRLSAGSGYGGDFRVVSEPRTFGEGETARTVHVHGLASAKDALALLTPEHTYYEYVARYVAARDALAAARDAVEEHDSNGYLGWTRYLLCTSSNGHVHRNARCSTCRPSTRFAPVVSLSGSTADEAIAALGETLCSVCYPDAPIAGKIGKLTKAQAKKILAGETLDSGPAVCPGSGTADYDRETARLGFYTGNSATCDHCGARVTVPKTGRTMRKHAPATEAAR